jgi:hypothetical protein
MHQPLPFLSRRLRGWILCIAALLCFCFACGCGDGRPKRAPISGRVTIDGKPLSSGSIVVHPAGTRLATSPIGPDGRFTLSMFENEDGCILGKHPLAVVGTKMLDLTTTEWLVPKKYADSATSGLEIDVTGPRDDVEIKLTWEGSPPGRPFKEKMAEEPAPTARRAK